VACSGTSTTPAPASTTVLPFGTTSASGPLPTPWPGHVVEALVQLAVVDPQFQLVGTDLNDAITAGDLKALLIVTKNVHAFLTANQKYIPALQGYPMTKTLGDGLAASYAQMIQGITQIEDFAHGRERQRRHGRVRHLHGRLYRVRRVSNRSWHPRIAGARDEAPLQPVNGRRAPGERGRLGGRIV